MLITTLNPLRAGFFNLVELNLIKLISGHSRYHMWFKLIPVRLTYLWAKINNNGIFNGIYKWTINYTI